MGINYPMLLAHFLGHGGCYLPPEERQQREHYAGESCVPGVGSDCACSERRAGIPWLRLHLSLIQTSLCAWQENSLDIPPAAVGGKAGRLILLETASLHPVLAVKSKHKHSGVKSAQLEGSPAPSHLHNSIQTSSFLCKTKGKEREQRRAAV